MRNRTYLSACALSILLTPVTPALAQSNEKPGSAYVQCDGQPDNVTDGETAARLIGAVTLLGLCDIKNNEYSFFPLLTASSYDNLIEGISPEEERLDAWRTRMVPIVGSLQADRLDLTGRFADSARVRDALIEFDTVQSPELNS